MEPADPAQLSHKLGQQDAIVEQQQQQLLAVMQCVQTMMHQMANLSNAVQAVQMQPAGWTAPTLAASDPVAVNPPPPPAAVICEPRLPPPERYDGAPGECQSFLTQCQLVFSLQPLMFPTDAARVAYIITSTHRQSQEVGNIRLGS